MAPTDLHITAASPEYNTGVTIASVTNDIDGDTRPQDAGYDIGADEVFVAPTPTPTPTITATPDPDTNAYPNAHSDTDSFSDAIRHQR